MDISLRRMRVSDLKDFLAYRTDPEVARYQGWDPMTVAEAEAFLSQMQAATFFIPGEWFQMGIEYGQPGSLVGDIGIYVNPTQTEAEIGISLHTAYQGKGIASKAISLALDTIFDSTPVCKVVANTDVLNQKAQGLFERLDFRLVEERDVVYQGVACREVCLERLRP